MPHNKCPGINSTKYGTLEIFNTNTTHLRYSVTYCIHMLRMSITYNLYKADSYSVGLEMYMTNYYYKIFYSNTFFLH